MPTNQNDEQKQPNTDDPLNGRTIEDLEPAELQKLADYVYMKLQRELLSDRDRMGLANHRPALYP